LSFAKKEILRTGNIKNGILNSMKILNRMKLIKLEYMEAVDLNDFTIIKTEIHKESRVAICIAAYVGGVRLIDNILFKLTP